MVNLGLRGHNYKKLIKIFFIICKYLLLTMTNKYQKEVSTYAYLSMIEDECLRYRNGCGNGGNMFKY